MDETPVPHQTNKVAARHCPPSAVAQVSNLHGRSSSAIAVFPTGVPWQFRNANHVRFGIELVLRTWPAPSERNKAFLWNRIKPPGNRVRNSIQARFLPEFGLLCFGLRTRRKRRGFCPVAAYRHVAPPAPAAMGLVKKEKSAFGPFAGFDVPEVGRANKLGNLLSQWEEQRIRLAPMSSRIQTKYS